MDGSRFDDLSRAVAVGLNRRRLLQGVAGAALAGALSRLGVRGSAAACPPDQIATRRGCICRTSGRPPANGLCPCPGGDARCGSSCVDIRTDQQNCGACGTVCPPGYTCVNRSCVATDPCAELDCDDGDPCTIDTCSQGVCYHDPYSCPPYDDGCHVLVCDGAGGCTVTDEPAPDGIPCNGSNAGDLCTGAGTCQGGVCTSQPKCVEGTIVGCQQLTGECDPETGSCAAITVENGTPCTPPLIITGSCLQEPVCIDGTCGYPHVPDGTPCEPLLPSEDACDHSPICANGVCVYQHNACDDPEALGLGPCQEIVGCDGNGGCLIGDKQVGAPCEDGYVCTSDSVCVTLFSRPGELFCGARQVTCNEDCFGPELGADLMQYWFPRPIGHPCASPDQCLQDGICHDGFCVALNKPDGTPCDPGECKGEATCQLGTCVSSRFDPDGTPCEHPDVCIAGATCLAGTCQGGGVLVGNQCEHDGDCCGGNVCRSSLFGRICIDCADLIGRFCGAVPNAVTCCPNQECVCTNPAECTTLPPIEKCVWR